MPYHQRIQHNLRSQVYCELSTSVRHQDQMKLRERNFVFFVLVSETQMHFNSYVFLSGNATHKGIAFMVKALL